MSATTDQRLDLVSLGEPLIGIYPVSGSNDMCRAALGGDTSNVALAAARLGLRAAYATAVGVDPYGDRFLRAWAERGVDTSLVIRDEQRFTGLYVISFDQSEHRFAYYRKGSAASAYAPGTDMQEAIASARVLHISGISQAISTEMTELSFSLMRLAKDRDALVSYDVNYRPGLWSPDLAGAVAQRTISEFADIVSVNESELTLLGLGGSAAQFIESQAEHSKVVAVRDGESGAVIHMDGVTVNSPACPVNVVDTVGAGDAFDAALITAILRGRDAASTGRFANAVAALTCTEMGSTDGHQTIEQAEQKMKECAADQT